MTCSWHSTGSETHTLLSKALVLTLSTRNELSPLAIHEDLDVIAHALVMADCARACELWPMWIL